MKKAALVFSALLALSGLFACGSTQEQNTEGQYIEDVSKKNTEKNSQRNHNQSQKGTKMIGLEAIYGFEARPEGLQFLLKTNGCSDTDDFQLDIKQIAKTPPTSFTIELRRIKPDRCKAMARLEYIVISTEKPIAQNSKLKLKNPFVVDSRLRRPKQL